MKNAPFVIAAIVTGLLASGYAIIFKFFSESSIHLFEQNPLLWSFLVPLGFGSSFYFVKRYSPASAGSGIPQVMAALHYKGSKDADWLNRLLGVRVILIKALSSLICVVTGGAIGREGPTIQIGASVFVWISKFFPESNHANNPQHEQRRMRNLIMAGGACGIAAAFNTPLGGIVFAIEELAQESFRQFRTSVLLAVIISGMTAQWIMGDYLYLGKVGIHAAAPFITLFLCPFLGALGGSLGGIFGKLLFYGVNQRRKAKKNLTHLLWILGLSAIFIGLAFFSHGMSLGPGTEKISLLLRENTSTSFISIWIRFFSNQITFLVGGAGGIFAPSLSIGAHLGGWISSFFSSAQAEPNLLAAVGMVAFLTGVTHAPLTSVILVVEMTNQPQLLFSLMLAGLLANSFSKKIEEKSFYERVYQFYCT